MARPVHTGTSALNGARWFHAKSPRCLSRAKSGVRTNRLPPRSSVRSPRPDARLLAQLRDHSHCGNRPSGEYRLVAFANRGCHSRCGQSAARGGRQIQTSDAMCRCLSAGIQCHFALESSAGGSRIASGAKNPRIRNLGCPESPIGALRGFDRFGLRRSRFFPLGISASERCSPVDRSVGGAVEQRPVGGPLQQQRLQIGRKYGIPTSPITSNCTWTRIPTASSSGSTPRISPAIRTSASSIWTRTTG